MPDRPPEWARDHLASTGSMLLWLGEQIDAETGPAVEALRAAHAECSYWHGRAVAATTERCPIPDLAGRYEVATATARAMAAVYAHRPDYREEWRP